MYGAWLRKQLRAKCVWLRKGPCAAGGYCRFGAPSGSVKPIETLLRSSSKSGCGLCCAPRAARSGVPPSLARHERMGNLCSGRPLVWPVDNALFNDRITPANLRLTTQLSTAVGMEFGELERFLKQWILIDNLRLGEVPVRQLCVQWGLRFTPFVGLVLGGVASSSAAERRAEIERKRKLARKGWMKAGMKVKVGVRMRSSAATKKKRAASRGLWKMAGIKVKMANTLVRKTGGG